MTTKAKSKPKTVEAWAAYSPDGDVQLTSISRFGVYVTREDARKWHDEETVVQRVRIVPIPNANGRRSA